MPISVFDAMEQYRTSEFPRKEGQKTVLGVEDRSIISNSIDNDSIKNLSVNKKVLF